MGIIPNIIGGKETAGRTFDSASPFADLTLQVARYGEKDAQAVREGLASVAGTSKERRAELLRALADYKAPEALLEEIALMTGVPIALVSERIDEGKDLARSFGDRVEETQGKSMCVAIPSNDSRESFYFIGHVLVSGSPAVMKPSRREPGLTTDIVRYLLGHGLDGNSMHVIHGDTTDTDDLNYLAQTRKGCDVSIVMGATDINGGTIHFDGDYSRALVLDAEQALGHMKATVESPLSCLAEHNYIVVGEEQYAKVVEGLERAYREMQGGDLLNRNTRRGKIEGSVLEQARAMLQQGVMFDCLKYRYGSATSLDCGVVVEHYSEDDQVGSNPLMTSPLPLYLTGVRCVDSLEAALGDLERARNKIGRCMALAVYGDLPKVYRARVEALAYETHYNKSPSKARGIVHQGIDLRERLRRGAQ